MFDENAKGWNGYLRCYAEAGDSNSAQPIADQISVLLRQFVDPVLMPIEPYWKIPEYQHLLYHWKLDGYSLVVHSQIKDAFETTWQGDTESGFIWDYRMHEPLKIPRMRWMHLEYRPTSTAGITENNDSCY